MVEQLDFLFPSFRANQPDENLLRIGSRFVPVRFIRNDAARRYILRLGEDGAARVTVPRRGSFRAARQFVERHLAWIEKQLQKRESQPAPSAAWTHGTEILFRGEKARLQAGVGGREIRFADQFVAVAGATGNLRPAIEQHLRKLAASELIPRTLQLAALHQLTVSRVVVRSQRSRWGSCSVRKTVSLNWRLIQTPGYVRDYIILHELMHLREMNHSRRFWREVEQVCPDYSRAEDWLKRHGSLLR